MNRPQICILDNQTSSLPEVWPYSCKGRDRVREILTDIGIKDEIGLTVGQWKLFHTGKFILYLLTIVSLCSSLLGRNQGFSRNIYTQNVSRWTNRLSEKRCPQSRTAPGIYNKAPLFNAKIANHLLTLMSLTLMMFLQPLNPIEGEPIVISVSNIATCHNLSSPILLLNSKAYVINIHALASKINIFHNIVGLFVNIVVLRQSISKYIDIHKFIDKMLIMIHKSVQKNLC